MDGGLAVSLRERPDVVVWKVGRSEQTLLERHLLQWTHEFRREGQPRQGDLQRKGELRRDRWG
jgi:hypothetical protein